MTSPDKLPRNEVVHNEANYLTDEITSESGKVDASETLESEKLSSGLVAQRAILESSLYWGIDWGSLGDGEPW